MHSRVGDRLEILLVYERIEALRRLGRSITAGDDCVLPNVDGVLRQLMELEKGVVVEKYFAGHGVCKGKLTNKEKVNSTLCPGQERDAWTVKYDADGHEEDFEEEELRSGKDGPAPANGDGKPVLVVRHLPDWQAICNALAPGFAYLEERLTGHHTARRPWPAERDEARAAAVLGCRRAGTSLWQVVRRRLHRGNSQVVAYA